ncbi:MAG: hypothetical protein LBC56_02995 [Oscillospiraceae bacterium]|jgi:hypothetical protein|nr:hypothetical protein [Oscillospiraceae bacterium]
MKLLKLFSALVLTVSLLCSCAGAAAPSAPEEESSSVPVSSEEAAPVPSEEPAPSEAPAEDFENISAECVAFENMPGLPSLDSLRPGTEEELQAFYDKLSNLPKNLKIFVTTSPIDDDDIIEYTFTREEAVQLIESLHTINVATVESAGNPKTGGGHAIVIMDESDNILISISNIAWFVTLSDSGETIVFEEIAPYGNWTVLIGKGL